MIFSADIIWKENSINHLASLSDCVEAHKKFELADVVYLIKSGIEVSKLSNFLLLYYLYL